MDKNQNHPFITVPVSIASSNWTTTSMKMTEFESPHPWFFGLPEEPCHHNRRRSLLMMGLGMASPFLVRVPTTATISNDPQNAAWAVLPTFARRDKEKNKVFFVGSTKNASDSLQRAQTDLGQQPMTSTSEQWLLKLLPVKNPVFRQLERAVVAISTLRYTQEYAVWNKAKESIQEAIVMVDTKRSKLEPIFNPEEDTMIQIIKGEKGEQFIEAFREQLVQLANATAARNETQTFLVQKRALLALANVGGQFLCFFFCLFFFVERFDGWWVGWLVGWFVSFRSLNLFLELTHDMTCHDLQNFWCRRFLTMSLRRDYTVICQGSWDVPKYPS
jgi:hypothetical protein